MNNRVVEQIVYIKNRNEFEQLKKDGPDYKIEQQLNSSGLWFYVGPIVFVDYDCFKSSDSIRARRVLNEPVIVYAYDRMGLLEQRISLLEGEMRDIKNSLVNRP